MNFSLDFEQLNIYHVSAYMKGNPLPFFLLAHVSVFISTRSLSSSRFTKRPAPPVTEFTLLASGLMAAKSSSTIKEVAKLADVSIATVSRVFNDSAPVDHTTRQRVKEAAQRLRYVPHAVGRSLSTQRTDAIGLLLPDLFGEFFSEVIRGCDQTVQKNRYHLLVSSSHSSREEIEVALRMMRGRVDGLVIMSPHVDAQTMNANLPQSLPVVLLDCFVDGDTVDSITIDNFGGAYAMVKHLFGHGYRRIAIIKGTEDNLDAVQRLNGYRAAVAEFGGDRADDLEQSGNFSEASGYAAARNLLSLPQPPRAILASNDAMAIGALSALRDAGVQVPGDVALAGFDDIPIGAFLTPALSSVHVGIDYLGVLAIESVLRAIREKNSHRKQQSVIATTLSIRESCGCQIAVHDQQSRNEERR